MKKAFTLAEVLITLMIIGIVAALTIPSVISNYQQQEFKTGLKKAVSVLNEAIQTNIAIDGETPYENGNLFAYLQKRMSILSTGISYTCYKTNGDFEDTSKNNKTCSGWFDENAVFYTIDGMRFETSLMDGYRNRNLKLHETGLNLADRYNADGSGYVDYYSDSSIFEGRCGSYGLLNNQSKTKYMPCVVTVDVNGDKKPNTLVRAGISGHNASMSYMSPEPSDKKLTDVFNILITEDRAIPFGVVAQRAMYSK